MSGGILSGGYCPGGYCLGGYCPDTVSSAFNPYLPIAAKSSLENLVKSLCKSTVLKIFVGEIVIATFPITLLLIFCKITLNSKAIVKGVVDPADNFFRNP